jgi:hypothetical protein
MSDPIRKVGGPGGLPGAGEVGGSDGEAFRASLESSREVPPTRASASEGIGHVAELAGALKTGAIEPSTVVERLVEKALAAPAARGLTDAGRAQLERALRTSLAEDPTLLAMQADLLVASGKRT